MYLKGFIITFDKFSVFCRTRFDFLKKKNLTDPKHMKSLYWQSFFFVADIVCSCYVFYIGKTRQITFLFFRVRSSSLRMHDMKTIYR